MEKYKKGMVLLVALMCVFLVSIVVWGEGQKEALGDVSVVKVANKPLEEQQYVMVVLISTHPFWTKIKQGAQDAADQLGVKFKFMGPVEFDAAAQANQLEQLIDTKPSGIMVGSYDPSMTNAINKAVDAGIPVVTIDSDAPDSQRLSFVGPDHYQSGVIRAKKMDELLGGNGEVGLLTVISQTNLQEQVRGMQDYFAQNAPGIKIVAIEDNGGDDQITADKTKAIIQAHPDIDGIIVVNATGSGVATALKEIGKVGAVRVLTGDVSDPILQGIMEGAIDATSCSNIYLEGFVAVKMLFDYANGNLNNVPGVDVGVNPLPPFVAPGDFFITKENAEAFMSYAAQ